MKNLKAFGMALAIMAVSAIITSLAQSSPSQNGSQVAADQSAVAPSWELKDVNDKTIRSADFKGKVVILDFWATWCAPCRKEIPGFIALQKKYAQQGLVIVGASVDEGGASMVKQFMEKLGMNYPVVLTDEKMQDQFGGIEVVPTTFVIDREGHIVKKYFGLTDEGEFEQEIKPLLNP
jgi:peroxiredoxin